LDIELNIYHVYLGKNCWHAELQSDYVVYLSVLTYVPVLCL